MITTPSLVRRGVTAAALAAAITLAAQTGLAAAQELPAPTLPSDPATLELQTTQAAAQASSTSLSLSKSDGLDPAGELISVTGHGFAPGQGVYVMFCVEPAGGLGTADGRADTCNPDQSNDHTVWKTPVGADGEFTVDLRVESTFDSTDCTTVTCGVFVRRDHMGGASDYSQDTFAPVTFTGAQPTATTTPTSETTRPASVAASATGAPATTTGSQLAETGANTRTIAALGGLLLVAGAVLTTRSRRRASTDQHTGRL
jgi:LPXTG-motif cell wall-anchored protein